MNKWGIPDWLEREVAARDKLCAYCGIEMLEVVSADGPRKAVATWEHIINDLENVSRENIVRCCTSCNSSKGQKKLVDWIQSPYCRSRSITKDTVSTMVKQALRPKADERSAEL